MIDLIGSRCELTLFSTLYKIKKKMKGKKLFFRPELRKIPLHQRKCRFKDEIPDKLSIFREYSRDSCLYECKLLFLKNKFGCIPNFLSPIRDNFNCDPFAHNLQAGQILSVLRADISRNCSCYEDCQSATFSFSVSSTLIEPDDQLLSEVIEHQYFLKRLAI